MEGWTEDPTLTADGLALFIWARSVFGAISFLFIYFAKGDSFTA
jgi:hypothetical protein